MVIDVHEEAKKRKCTFIGDICRYNLSRQWYIYPVVMVSHACAKVIPPTEIDNGSRVHFIIKAKYYIAEGWLMFSSYSHKPVPDKAI